MDIMDIKSKKESKKKEFTLVELLAVIVILAVIALISTPIILNVIEESKKGAAEQSALGYIDALEKQIVINSMDEDTSNNIGNGVFDIKSLEVNIKGTKPTSGSVTITKGKVETTNLIIGNYSVKVDENGKATTTQWSNVSLASTTRTIITHIGTPSTVGGTLPTAFSYEEYAARLLTIQEINSACSITISSYKTGELDNCNYLMENTKYSNKLLGTYGYWLENLYSIGNLTIWYVNSYGSYSSSNNANVTNKIGARPVIEILKSEIDY